MSLLLTQLGGGGGEIREGAITVIGLSSVGHAAVALRVGALTASGQSASGNAAVAIRVGAMTANGAGEAAFGGGVLRVGAFTVSANSITAFSGEATVVQPPPPVGGVKRQRIYRVHPPPPRPSRIASGRLVAGSRLDASFSAVAIRPGAIRVNAKARLGLNPAGIENTDEITTILSLIE